MRNPGCQSASVFALAGGIVAAVTLLLFYQLIDVSARGETFAFTVWFVIFQEAVLFGSLALSASGSGRTATTLPVRMGYVTTVVFYNFTALATVALFNFVLLPHHASPRSYYTVAIAETGLWLALLVTLQLVEIAHHASHRHGNLVRVGVDTMLLTCDRVRVLSELHGWGLAASLRELAERIRFSEGLRQDGRLFEEVASRLDALETLASAGGDESAEQAAGRLVQEISTMATRRG